MYKQIGNVSWSDTGLFTVESANLQTETKYNVMQLRRCDKR